MPVSSFEYGPYYMVEFVSVDYQADLKFFIIY